MAHHKDSRTGQRVPTNLAKMYQHLADSLARFVAASRRRSSGSTSMNIQRPYGIIAAKRQVPPEASEESLLLESQNPGMAALLKMVKRAAAGDSTILLTGETGTGKDVLARQIHRWSPRR